MNNLFDKKIRNIIRNVIMEETSSVINLTNEINEYLKLCSNSDIINADASIKASKLHRYIMDTIFYDGSHQEDEMRRIFAKILNAVKPMMKRGAQFFYDKDEKQWICKGKTYDYYKSDYEVCGNGDYVSEDSFYICNMDADLAQKGEYAIPFSDKGINYGRREYREGAFDGYIGIWDNPEDVSISKQSADQIRSKGLVPVIVSFGTYHNNFFSLYGVFPEKWEEFKRLNDGCIITSVQ